MAAPLGEFGRIDRFFKPLAAGLPGALGLADDAGLVAPPLGTELVVTTDAMVEGVHFLPDEDPVRLGRKLLRVNLSDLAAMGARPLAYTLTTVLPRDLPEPWVEALARGLALDQARYGIALLGGDSVVTPGPVVLSVTALGTVPAARALRRNGARAGDAVWVSGTLGDAALGLDLLRGGLPGLPEGAAAALADRLRLPEPRLALGQALIGLATAAMDVSDGLAGDLAHICAASGLGARVEAARLPLSPAVLAAIALFPQARRRALMGGDDYELLFTAPPGHRPRLLALAEALGVALSEIGVMVPGQGVLVLDPQGRPIEGLAGWTHF